MDLDKKFNSLSGLELRILQESKNEFEKTGYYRANVDKIAQRLGIGKGTIYRHFKNKMMLFASVMIQMFKKNGEAVLTTQEIPDFRPALDDFIQKLTNLLMQGQDIKNWSSLESLDVFKQEKSSSAELRQIFNFMISQRTRILGALESILKKGQKESQIDRNIDPVVSAEIILASIAGYIQSNFFFGIMEKNLGHGSKKNKTRAGLNLKELKKFIYSGLGITPGFENRKP